MDPVTAISIASSVAGLLSLSGTILSEGYSYLAKVAKAPKELRLLLSETATLNSLLDQLQLVVEGSETATTGAVQDMVKLGVLSESRDLLQTMQRSLAAYRQVDGHSTRNLGKALLWPFKEKETMLTLQRFHKIRDMFTSALSIDSRLALKRIESASIDTLDLVAHIGSELEKRDLELEIAKMKAWLYADAVNPDENYEATLKVRQMGTGVWFTQESIFLEWLEADKAFMWVHGIPGCGKTVLSATIIEYLQGITRSANAGLIYFYCTHQDPLKQSLRSFISTSISQLLRQEPQCIDDALSFYRRRKHDTRPSLNDCFLLLQTLTLRFQRTFVVVDALDECTEIENFLDTLAQLSDPNKSTMRTHVLVTSRHEIKIERLITPSTTSTFSLTTNIGKDIQKYIAVEVRSRILDGKLKLRNPNLVEEIIYHLSNTADGMFLWAKIQIDRICDLRTDRAIKEALNKLPRGLEETFVRMLVQIQTRYPESLHEVKRIFRWLIGSTALLTLGELSEAISIEPNDRCFDPDGVATEPEDIIALCGPLVAIDRSASIPYVGFVHYSIEEFLTSDRIKETAGSNFYMNIAEIELELAKTCIQYLSFVEFRQPCSDISNGIEMRDRIQNHRLLAYATGSWFIHLRRCQEDTKSLMHHILPKLQWFLNPSKENQQFTSWKQLYHSHIIGLCNFSALQSPTYYATLFGLDKILDHIFPPLTEVDCYVNSDSTLLHVATMAGHPTIVRKLLAAGASVDLCKKRRLLTSLHIAAECGHVDIVKILLKAGAQPHGRSDSQSTPFYRAARGGSLEILDLLYKEGSDVNARTWDNWTPVHEAIENGHMAVLQRLISWGADLRIKNDDGFDALAVAKEFGQLDMVKVLEDALGVEDLFSDDVVSW